MARRVLSCFASVVGAFCVLPAARAQDSVEVEDLRKRIEAIEAGAQEEIERLRRENEVLREDLRALGKAVEGLRGGQERLVVREETKPTEPERLEPAGPPPQRPPEEVGEAPKEDALSNSVDLFTGLTGILTPRGTMFAETAVTYSTSSDNRFFFSGVEIIDALIIGVIEARDIDRTSASVTQSVRLGLTNRLEVAATLPVVWQEDRTADVAIADPRDSLTERDGSGIGDVSFGLHYQLNGGKKWPYMVANLRAKAPTGEGIFEVQDGEAPTGSGYWTIEPSLTFIKRTDPVVLFGNIGYQMNFETEVGLSSTEEIENSQGPELPPILTTTTTRFIDFDPGDAVRGSFGIGIALNEQVNLNFGYDQSFVLSSRTVTETSTISLIDGDVVGSDGPTRGTRTGQNTTIGSFLFGVSYRVGGARMGLSTAIGTTDEAPDVSIAFRSQYRF